MGDQMKEEIKFDYEEIVYSIEPTSKNLKRLKRNLKYFYPETIFNLKKEVDFRCRIDYAPMKKNSHGELIKNEMLQIFDDIIEIQKLIYPCVIADIFSLNNSENFDSNLSLNVDEQNYKNHLLKKLMFSILKKRIKYLIP